MYIDLKIFQMPPHKGGILICYVLLDNLTKNGIIRIYEIIHKEAPS